MKTCLLIILSMFLIGCGQYGSLYLPNEKERYNNSQTITHTENPINARSD